MFFFLSNLISCGQGVKPTPDNYKYKVTINANDYSADSTYLSFVLETMLAKSMHPFQPATYYTKATKIYIDSILYSPDKLKLVILIISKVPKGRSSLSPGIDYNGNFLFCKRNNIDSAIKVYDYSAFTLGNYDSYNELKVSLFEYCFGRRATDHPWSEKEPKYNMDDIRFWSSDEYNTIVTNYQFIRMQY